jgi:hypothetical protein
VATAIVRKLNPECGFVLVDKLEQMDPQTMREFGEWLEAEGLQVIATRVTGSGEDCTILIEDGAVQERMAEVVRATKASSVPAEGGATFSNLVRDGTRREALGARVSDSKGEGFWGPAAPLKGKALGPSAPLKGKALGEQKEGVYEHGYR